MKTRIIVISGIDGSGKSTIIEALQKDLNDAGCSPYTPWLRYNHYLTKGVFAVAKMLGLYSYDVKDGVRVAAYHEFYRSRLISSIFVASTYIDTLIASFLKVYIPFFIYKKTVICDRWIPDIIIDMAIDNGKTRLVRDWVWDLFWRLIPKSAELFIIIRDSNDVLNCRKENQLNRNFKIQFKLYKEMVELSKVRLIDNSGTIDQAVRKITEAIELENDCLKNARRK
jgi:thymidylate kinase